MLLRAFRTSGENLDFLKDLFDGKSDSYRVDYDLRSDKKIDVDIDIDVDVDIDVDLDYDYNLDVDLENYYRGYRAPGRGYGADSRKGYGSNYQRQGGGKHGFGEDFGDYGRVYGGGYGKGDQDYAYGSRNQPRPGGAYEYEGY